MENNKFTPGPWKFEKTKTDIEYAKMTGKELLPHEGYFRDNDGGWFVNGIAKVFYKGSKKKGYGEQDDEGMANSALISSAPELLAALEIINVKVPDSARRQVVHAGQLGVYLRLDEIDQIRAAIAKAKGDK
jgi:hypothetical protein